MTAQFKFSAELKAHDMDVRALAVSPSNANVLFSASRDKSVKEWLRTDSLRFQQQSTFLSHTHFVNALAFFPPNEDHSQGLVASGSMDKTILIWSPDQPAAPLLTLLGHTDTVCCLYVDTTTKRLYSSSWDKTIRVWKGAECVLTLKGHEQAVWAVLGYTAQDGAEHVISASADKTLKLWKDGKCVKTIQGLHKDVVRGLTFVPSLGFSSCSNDGSVRVWTLTGEPLLELHGHTSFVYAVDHLPSGELVSSGEDKTVRIWKDGMCIQTLIHPAISVWAVKAMCNGDLVSGCNDGVVRIFSRDPSRYASSEELKAYEDQVANSTVQAKTVGDVDKSKLPGVEALSRPGKKDQEVIMVRNGNAVEAHQWSRSSQSWAKLGEVVDAVGSGRKQLYQGREYDYVFDVDIAEGAPPLKLPYNVIDNPYQTAQEFIHQHELPQEYLDQVANFIIKNAAGAATLGSATMENGDPFTGTNRYVPASQSQPNTGQGIASAVNPDPFTGSYGSSRPPIAKVIPLSQDGVLSFKPANIVAMHKKLLELNSTITGDAKLFDHEVKMLDGFMVVLQNPQIPSSTFKPDYWSLIQKTLKWPIACRFPGLDILRLVVLYTDMPLQTSPSLTLQHIVEWSALDEPGTPDPAVMLGLRTVANMFTRPAYRQLLIKDGLKALPLLTSHHKSSNKNITLALSTIYLNLSIIQVWDAPNGALATELLSDIIEFTRIETDPESLYRCGVAVGNLLFKFSEVREALRLMEFDVVKAKMLQGDDRMQFLVRELESLLQ